MDLIFIFVRNRQIPKMSFFVGVQIQLLSAASVWNLPLEIRIHHRVIWIHSSYFSFVLILLLWIQILSIWIRIITLKLRFLSVLSVLSERFALRIRFIPETLSNLIRNNSTSILVSSKSSKGLTNYWWSGMKKDLTNFMSRCLVCQQIKAEHQ